MKKILLSLFVFSSLTSSAQLANGSIAPDFTLTDIYGVPHHLYDYLDAGKTVYIDVSATWCGPCWGFHESHALEQLYTDHGPAGATGVSGTTTDDVIVLFVEGDGATNSADLDGTGTSTQGDWLTGSNYPIIDPAAAQINQFNYNYNIAFFPSIYMICPNRKITEIGQGPPGPNYYTGAEMYALAGDCPAPASQATDVAAFKFKGADAACGPTSYTPIVQIQNNGTSPLTSATITIKIAGATVSTGTYSGSLTTYELADVTCSIITNFSSANLTIEVTTVNDQEPINNSLNFNVNGAIIVDSRILFSITTDDYADEIGWSILDANNLTVTGTTNPTLTNATAYNFTYNMPSLGCYTLKVTDEYGDGLIGSGAINVRDKNNVVLLNNPDYGDVKLVPFKVVSITETAGLTENTATAFGLEAYPNPSNGAANVKVALENESSISISVYNMIGEVVYQVPATTLAAGTHVYPVNLMNAQSGVYFAHVSVNGTNQVVKINVVK
jgi:hypothetical protein